jgi:hypothetical protein
MYYKAIKNFVIFYQQQSSKYCDKYQLKYKNWLNTIGSSQTNISLLETKSGTLNEKLLHSALLHLSQTNISFFETKSGKNYIPHCFICRASDSTVLEEAEIEPKTLGIGS